MKHSGGRVSMSRQLVKRRVMYLGASQSSTIGWSLPVACPASRLPSGSLNGLVRGRARGRTSVSCIPSTNRSQQGIHSASTRGSSQLTELLEDADEDNIFEIVRHLTLYAAKRRGLQVEGEDEVMEMVEDLWAAIYSDTYKLAVWAACYILLGAFFFCTWASAQAWVYLPSQALLPAQGRQIIVLTSKVLATAAASGFCISAALHLKPEAADPLPQSVQESYSHLDELLPILQDLRIINFFAMLLVCGKLMIRLWA